MNQVDRPKVIEFCFGQPASGGPIVSLERVIQSPRYVAEFRAEVILQSEGHGGFDIPTIIRWARLVRRQKPDLVHCRGLGNEGFHSVLAARLGGAKRILVSVHGSHADLAGRPNFKRYVVIKLLEPLTLTMATHVATVSSWGSKRGYLRRWEKKIVGAVPNGVKEPLESSEARLALREQFGFKDSDVVGIVVGRLSWEKGFRWMGQALSADDPILVVGDGPDKTSIERYFQSLGLVNITYAGRRRDVLSLMRACDYLLFPSLHENSPNVVAEAMSVGLPIVGSDIPAVREMVPGSNGRLVQLENVAELRSALAAINSSPHIRSQMGELSKARFRERYTLEQMVDGWVRLYRHVLNS